jgi:hypothetical protein
MEFDQTDQCVPKHHRLHFRQELNPLGLLLNGRPFKGTGPLMGVTSVVKEAELPDADQSSPGLQSHCHSPANGLAFKSLPNKTLSEFFSSFSVIAHPERGFE